MKNSELINITGGDIVSPTVLNAIVRMTSNSLEIGRILGTIIRRMFDKSLCSE